jgi:hypothetical protein
MSSPEKQPITIDVTPNADGVYEVRDIKGDFESRIKDADFNPDSHKYIVAIIQNIEDAYTDKNISPKRLSNYGYTLRAEAIKKMQQLIMQEAQMIDTVDGLMDFFLSENIEKLLKRYTISSPDRDLENMKAAEYERCFRNEIQAVKSHDESWKLSQRINQWYNRAGFISLKSGELNTLLSEVTRTLPPEKDE